ncbi:galactocerebrosidase-like isoform X2 [Haliotis rubra]|uniref:galactocerebrosidase-like isoform X2 n=1 Tax=Haliotis rubra TaxID=36100 RepID=UPI001EE539FD|nr:galactocerebrosidase-like isoform X2 [Haliotis rubra]
MMFATLAFAAVAVFVELSAGVVIFDDSVGLERQFDGIGGLSGGGATSKLLVNYPKKQRDEILDYLFKPNFGASLQILKVEIGGDAQSTDGTESSHMHNSWEENYQRGYEWWLMLEAKKRNPNIKLYGLPWTFPGWVGDGTRSPYTNPKQTATYILKWVQGAKKYYNLTIDYIGVWNERDYNIPYIKILRKTFDDNGLSNVRMVAADGGWGIANDIQKDSVLASAIDYIGTHYPGTLTTTAAMKTGKQLWSSEDFSTFNDNVGGGCWARILNQNYVNGYMTSTISWNLIASYYQALPFYRDGLMTAVEPWSGNYVVQSPIWITAHTTQFTEIGWKYLRHGAGVGKLETGGSFVGLVSPDEKDLTIVIETMSHDHSLCIRPALPPYNVTPATVEIEFKGSFAALTSLNVWYSKPSYGNEADVFFMKQNKLSIVNGKASLKVNPDEIYTLTTLEVGQKGTFDNAPPASKPFPLPYTEDFEGYEIFMEPYDLAQQMGVFEVAQDDASNKVMRQKVLAQPVVWCQAESLKISLNVIGSHNWTDIYAEVDVKLGEVNGTNGVFVAARVDQGGCNAFSSTGIFLYIFPKKNNYILANNLGRTSVITSGQLGEVESSWNKVSLMVKGTVAVGMLNGKTLFNHTVPSKPASGFVGLGTDSWGIADFDNLKITSAEDQLHHLHHVKKEDAKLYFVPGAH